MEVPVPGLVFSAAYYFIAAITLSLLRLASSDIISKESKNDGDFILANETSHKSKSSQLSGGFELGSYLFIGNCLQVVGLKEVPADRAAFLVQLTTVFVPIAAATFAGNFSAVPIPTWFACIIAFLGVIIMGLDAPKIDNLSFLSTSSDLFKSGLSFSSSDFLIILAALAYTMHVVRLSAYAKNTSPLGLAASKATVEAGLSIGLVAVLLNAGTTKIEFWNELSSDVQTYFSIIQSQIASGSFPPTGSEKAIGAVFWTAWVTCAYTIYAQSYGQRRVSATDANLIYTVQPVFSSFFAWFLLGEQLNMFGYIGAFLIGCAVWIVASFPEDSLKN
jgi:drug/metabolite transporter (DMT)-like permease